MQGGMHEILQKYWGYQSFRPQQEEIIQSILDQKDCLALLPTGGGKSLCYQVPALMLEGVTIVVSPLIALMKDQVDALRKRTILAGALYSGMSAKEIDVTLDNCLYGDYKFLYVSPERVQTELFQQRFQSMKVALIAIDEAHCVSQWGYDFRPPYLQLAQLREVHENVPMVALTASATPAVQTDIIEKLALKDVQVFRQSFLRPNLSFSVYHGENKLHKIEAVIQKVEGPGLIYVNSRKDSVTLADFLKRRNVSSDYYHAGLSPDIRDLKQENWLNNKTRVMVATNAFGMGIDKPDVRFVIHYSPPRSLEAYYQEAGRAGRDGVKSYALLLYHNQDIELLKNNIERSYPVKETIQNIYQALGNYFNLALGSLSNESVDFDIEKFSAVYNFKPIECYYALKRLEESEILQFNESFHSPSKLKLLVDHKELYKYQVANSSFDTIIKLLLRTYGGQLYGHFTTISEEKLGRGLNLSGNKVVDVLNRLHEHEVIYYIKRKSMPQLTFLIPRTDKSKIPLDVLRWKNLKQRDEERLKAVMNYLNNNDTCRANTINQYFGEESTVECGICDCCVNSKKELSVEQVGALILNKLEADKVYEINDIAEGLGNVDSTMVVYVLREFMDQGIIEQDNTGKIKVLK